MRRASRITVVLLLVGALFAAPGRVAALTPPDVEQSWARESIMRLMESGIVAPYPDNVFRPEQAITRGEFAQMAVQAFQLEGEPDRIFVDAQNHPAREALALLVEHGALQPGKDTTVRPDDPLSRVEAAHALVALLGLQELQLRVGHTDPPAFEDVPGDHPLYSSVQTAARLHLFPPFIRGRLWTEEPVTRAEAAYMLDSALRLEKYSGTLERIDSERQVLWMSGPGNGQRSFPVRELDVFEPEGKRSWHEVEPGRSLHLVVNRFGRPLIAWADPAAPYEGLRERLRQWAAALLTPEQLRALLDGDWEQVGAAAKAVLYQELVAQGLRPWEADALLSQDWASAQELGILRLTELVSQYLQVSPELVHAVIDRDWEAARDHAQMEVLERLLQARLFDTTAPGDPAPAAPQNSGATISGGSS